MAESAIGVPGGYRGAAHRAPLRPVMRGRLRALLGHKGEPWITDIEERLAGDGLDVFAVAFSGEEPVAHTWLGSAHACSESAVLGHVYTAAAHRRRGLARAVLGGALAAFDDWGGRWVLLGTSNDAAAQLYAEFGFQVLQRDGERRTMLRGGADEAYWEASGRWALRPLKREHYAGAAMLLNLKAGTGKLPMLGVDIGVAAEPGLLTVLVPGRAEGLTGAVLVDEANGRVHGLACRRGDELQVYSPHREKLMRQLLTEETG